MAKLSSSNEGPTVSDVKSASFKILPVREIQNVEPYYGNFFTCNMETNAACLHACFQHAVDYHYCITDPEIVVTSLA